MTKKSKLTQKSARLSTGLEEKLKAQFKKYQDEISASNMETARSLRFSMLLRDWFSNAEPKFVEDYLRGIEKHVKIKEKDLVLTGRIDALYGNVIIEFEGNLSKKLKEAKEQLQRYVFGLLTKKDNQDVHFLCIASDGVQFYVFTPRWKNPTALPEDYKDIELRELDKVDFLKLEGPQAFLWLDRYFFRKTPLHPTTEEFVRDFGINSPAYAFAIKLLEKEWRRVEGKSEFKVIYENWEKYLRIAYGTTVADTELFLRHTYLAAFAKLLAFMRLADKSVPPTAKEVDEVFTGKFFQKRGIQNFLEEDFLSWIARDSVRSLLLELIGRIATLLEKYYLQEISEDVLTSLYQELVDPNTRHDLGEFYTPDWLADKIVRHALKNNPEASVLDPSCGSGSFLYFTIRYKIERLGASEATLRHIQDNVIGIDIHPLAVTIAKTNYLLGLGDLIKKRVKGFHIPIYMANSIRLPYLPRQMTIGEKVPSVSVTLDNDSAQIPEIFIEHSGAYDQAIDVCHDFANEFVGKKISSEQFKSVARKRITEIRVDDDALDVLYSVAERMHHLIGKDRNSIWTFVLKNVYKPLFLKKKFDWILGNPPWITLSDVEKGDY